MTVGDLPVWIASRASSPQDVLNAAYRRRGDDGPHPLDVDSLRGLTGAAAWSMLHWGLFRASNDERWARSAHDFMRMAIEGTRVNASIVDGWSGILHAAAFNYDCGAPYGDMIVDIADEIARYVLLTLRFDFEAQSSHQFEFLQGFAGMLTALSQAPGSSTTAEAAGKIVEYLTYITADTSNARWCLPNMNAMVADPPVQNLLGVSHGLAGIVCALLSSEVEGARDAALHLARALADYSINGALGPQWPYSLQSTLVFSGEATPARVSWCHFSLGIATIIWSAGVILGDDKLKQTALASISGIVSTDIERWGFFDDGMCHGTAGAAVLLAYIGRYEDDGSILKKADEISEMTCKNFDASLPFGFDTWSSGERYTDPGLLNGPPGIGLAALTLSFPAIDGWLRAFGIPTAQIALSLDRSS